MATEKRQHGDLGEEFAAGWLEHQGYQILARNYLTRMGELDIVAKKDDVVSIVEVKSRAEDCLYAPREAVTAAKRKKICKAAVLYIMETGEKARIRFDVFEVIYEKNTLQIKSYTFIPNAFEMEVRL
jgi:putative endonuclease